MGEPHVISALKSKRAEIAGVIAELEKELAERRSDLQHVDATLRMFSPDCAPEDIQPRKRHKRNAWFARGERTRLTFGVLRAASEPLTAHNITERLMAAKGVDPSDHDAREDLLTSVRRLLKRAHGKGVVERIGGDWGERAGWRVAP